MFGTAVKTLMLLCAHLRPCSVQMQPAIAGERGREALLKAAQTQARGRATPQGSLPAELWQLLLQARPLCHVSVSSIPEICMGVFDAPSRSRRDAILHVEAWLDRLRANGLSSAARLFDLTKAFDTLALGCIENLLRTEPMPASVRELLLDLHRRSRISLKQNDGATLQMKLESGVLQGGGTGPCIFRMVYDAYHKLARCHS